jgi:hypothetical protein
MVFPVVTVTKHINVLGKKQLNVAFVAPPEKSYENTLLRNFDPKEE